MYGTETFLYMCIHLSYMYILYTHEVLHTAICTCTCDCLVQLAVRHTVHSELFSVINATFKESPPSNSSRRKLYNEITSAYMVFHAEGLAGIELHYTAHLTVQPVGGFENSSHHFPSAESAFPAVDKPAADVPSPSYHSSGLLRM